MSSGRNGRPGGAGRQRPHRPLRLRRYGSQARFDCHRGAQPGAAQGRPDNLTEVLARVGSARSAGAGCARNASSSWSPFNTRPTQRRWLIALPVQAVHASRQGRMRSPWAGAAPTPSPLPMTGCACPQSPEKLHPLACRFARPCVPICSGLWPAFMSAADNPSWPPAARFSRPSPPALVALQGSFPSPTQGASEHPQHRTASRPRSLLTHPSSADLELDAVGRPQTTKHGVC